MKEKNESEAYEFKGIKCQKVKKDFDLRKL